MLRENKRNQTADVLKGLAVIFMIQVHIMEQFASVEVTRSIFGKITFFLGGPFCAPVFIAVMGYFLASSNKSFGFFFKRGIMLFLGGLALNIGRSIHLFLTIFQGKYELDPLFYIFGADILTLAGISIILLGFLRLISKRNLWLFIPILILFAFLDGFINTDNLTHGYYLGFIIGDFDHTYFPLFPWFAYVLAGYVFKIIQEKAIPIFSHISYFHWVVIVVLAFTIAVFTPFAFNLSTNLDTYYHHHYFNFFSWVMGFMLLYVLLINYLTKQLKNSYLIQSLSWIGQQVTSIYVIQWLIIGNIATAIFQTQNLLYSECWFVGILVGSCLLTLIYQKIVKYYYGQKENLI